MYIRQRRRTQEEKMCSGAWKCIRKPELYRKNGKEISLTDTELSILCTLMKHRKQIFSVEHLYEAVWEETYYYGAANIVMVHIRNLRSKIEDDPGKQELSVPYGEGDTVVIKKKRNERERKLTQSLCCFF